MLWYILCGGVWVYDKIYNSSVFCFGIKYEMFGKQRLFSGGKGDIDKEIIKHSHQICSFSLCSFRYGMKMAPEISSSEVVQFCILQSESDVIASCLSIEDMVHDVAQ